MEAENLDSGINMTQDQPEQTSKKKTNDFYRVNPNLPKRFNNPDCFKGYNMKVNPLYQTSNQAYGSKKPTVHEMPTTFHGARSKFSDHILKSGIFRDTGFDTSLDKHKILGPDTIRILQDRIFFHNAYHTEGNNQAATDMN